MSAIDANPTHSRFARVALEAENESVRIPTGTTMLIGAILTASMVCASTQNSPQRQPAQHAVPPPEARVDVNHATVEELLKVPGMTRSWAGRIVRFRPYRSKQDLLDLGIVNDEAYNRIRDYIIAHRSKQ